MSAYWLTGLAGKKIFGLGFFLWFSIRLRQRGPCCFDKMKHTMYMQIL